MHSISQQQQQKLAKRIFSKGYLMNSHKWPFENKKKDSVLQLLMVPLNGKGIFRAAGKWLLDITKHHFH